MTILITGQQARRRQRLASSRNGPFDAAAGAFLGIAAAPPSTWRAPEFGDRVELVRAQLAPIHSVGALVSSRARESHPRPESECARHPLPERLRVCPVEVAYVVRWIELVSRRRWATWGSLTNPDRDIPAR